MRAIAVSLFMRMRSQIRPRLVGQRICQIAYCQYRATMGTSARFAMRQANHGPPYSIKFSDGFCVMRKSVFFASAISVASVCFTPLVVFGEECKPLSTFQTITPGKLVVTSFVVPPLIFKQGDDYAGVDAEVIGKFAKDNCLELTHVTTDPAAAIQYVVTQRSDVAIGGWYRTAERARVLGVTNPVYLEETAIYSRTGWSNFGALEGKKVGTVSGYLWVPELKKIFGRDLSLYPTAVSLAQDLSAGRIDAAVNSYAVGVEGKKQGGLGSDILIKMADPDPRVKSSVLPSQSAYLYSKNNASLGNALNLSIGNMQKDGEIAALLTKYGLEAKSSEVGSPRFADQ